MAIFENSYKDQRRAQDGDEQSHRAHQRGVDRQSHWNLEGHILTDLWREGKRKSEALNNSRCSSTSPSSQPRLELLTRGAERMEEPEGMEGSCEMHSSGHDMALVCMGLQKLELHAQDMCKIKSIKTPARLGAGPLRLHS